MAAHPREFHRCKYTDPYKEKEFQPFVEISILSGDKKRRITALADTGCGPDLVISKSLLTSSKLGLTKKITKNPVSVMVADGSRVLADIYEAICQVGGEEKILRIYVIETGNPTTPLLGRGFFSAYDVLFEGKHKQLLFCLPK